MQNQQKIRAEAQAAIDLIVRDVKSAKAVVISSEDGFEVAAYVENTTQVTRMSAMASSLSALGALAGEESRLGECRNIIIEADAGILIIIQVRRAEETLIMSVITGTDAVVGQILYVAKQAARMLQTST
ncbi:roadblock/LC7 domain-containing protein [Undibacterium sp. Dicai25W]|uniref:roadblock/LC7 domain-containing protein n=1 Tax=Undibacterium sp. Dicai25W TaxID=3413034 RepID=UPI003BF3E7BA